MTELETAVDRQESTEYLDLDAELKKTCRQLKEASRQSEQIRKEIEGCVVSKEGKTNEENVTRERKDIGDDLFRLCVQLNFITDWCDRYEELPHMEGPNDLMPAVAMFLKDIHQKLTVLEGEVTYG